MNIMSDRTTNFGASPATAQDQGQGSAAHDEERPRSLTARDVWRRLWSPSATFTMGGLLLAGFIAGLVVYGSLGSAMEATNTEAFCVSCHEMERNAYREYRQSAHYANRTGVQTTCPDCHVPKGWVHGAAAKFDASRRLLRHFVGTIDSSDKFDAKRIDLAQTVWRTMISSDSRECRNCHNMDRMDFSMQENRAATKHQEGLNTGATCIDCHKGISHRLPAKAEQAAARLDDELGRLHQPTAPNAPKR
jgi:cytochrome c-type protein NapC